ncbi:RRM domain-containing protein [Caenorhabditis elegans]|uniref:RRM domain-containing protein n=2 Tax=Caenorhabditis elegans TaxID=6239 RepID=Q9U202_CAEEL|nr:RRM domain-containing protein [Caenorhabditis elegans]CAB54458.2 RRM domain-containing protein [Caenorhabditis elegans]|eukprot:NP_502785.2 Uncharacterized protein CELE_Y57G11C.9 [Caenorhabditis elegans]
MYHNNNYGYNNHRGGGGFRHNNYNNNNNNHHHHYNNLPRINETQVPQSKHTIFIRGLHGDISTEEIKEYIGEKVGKISFDFVKVAQDKSKIFVAVRFENRDEAKEFMETYSDREFMGCRCDLSWFRDIRRYCAYQRAKQVRSNSQRRRRRSDSQESSKRSASPPVRRGRSKSRSRSRSPSRSRSRSRSRSVSRSKSPASRNGRVSRHRSRSQNRSRSRSNTRSRSRSSGRSGSAHSRKSDDVDSFDDESFDEKSRVKDNEARQKRRRELSDDDRKDVRETQPKKSVKEELPQIPLPPKTEAAASPSPAPPTPKASKSASFIPPPTADDMELESPPHVSNNQYEYQQSNNTYNQIRTGASPVSVSYSVPMEVEATPKMIVRETPQPAQPPVQVNSYYTTTPIQQQQQQQQPIPPQLPTAPPQPPPTTPQPAFVPRQIGRIEIVMPSSLPAPVVSAAAASASAAAHPVAMNGSAISGGSSMPDITMHPNTNKLFGHLKAFQSALLSTVKYEPPARKEEDEAGFSTLRLSSLATEDDSADEEKAMVRELKLAKLNDEQMMRFHIKKKQLESAFRNDCETYAVVTRALLAKDESLQFGLKMALLENMEDLYKKMMQRVDDQLDALLVMA